METEKLLPKRVVAYIREMGVRALDHLADNVKPRGKSAAPAAVQALTENWKAMSAEEKAEFVDRVSASVVEVVAASAALPTAAKLGKKAVKATKKVLQREQKKRRKEAKRAEAKKDDPPKKKAGKGKAA